MSIPSLSKIWRVCGMNILETNIDGAYIIQNNYIEDKREYLCLKRKIFLTHN